MKIERLEMKNWRGYFGTQTIEFSTDPLKPVTVIIGDNKTGKSDILRAIHWVLFDEVPEHTKKRKDLINNYAEYLDPDSPAEVTLIISNDTDTYKLVRVLDKDLDKSNDPSRFYVDILTSSGVFDPLTIGKSEKNWVNANFLPDHLKHIFLFQGEVLANSFENESEEEIAAAVKNVTGTNYVSYAEELLRRYKVHKDTQQAKLLAKQQGQSSAAKKITDIETEIGKIEVKIKKLEDAEKELLAEKNSLSTHLIGSKNTQAAEASLKISQAENDINKYTKRVDDERDSLYKLISEFGASVFLSKSMKSLGDVDSLDEQATFLTNVKSPHREEALESLLKNKLCICGRDLKPGQDDNAIKKLENEISLATTNLQRSKITNITREIAVTLSRINAFGSQKESIETRLNVAKTDLEDARTRKQDGEEERNKSKLTVDERNASERIDEIDRKELPPIQSRLRHEKTCLDSEKTELQTVKRKVNTNIGKKDLGIEEINDQIEVADELLKTLENFTSNEESNIKHNLKSSMEMKVKKYGTGDDLFKYKENSLLPKLISPATGEENPQSEGGDNMKSIFFGTSLVEVSLNRTDTPAFIEPGVSFPFICDAPFSALDYTNERNATEMITELDSQIVYLVNPKAYISGIRDILGEMGKEGRRYFVERKVTGPLNSDSPTFEIGGARYTSFKGESNKEGSEIREVEVD